MTPSPSKTLHGLLLATSCLVGSTLISTSLAQAGGPTGGNVVVGHATIVNPNSHRTVVRQSSSRALINWNSFSIPGHDVVKFIAPNSNSITVNRVTGPDASTIYGQLLGNGNVWLLNSNGILFGRGSQVNVGGLIATTSDISNSDFRKRNYAFSSASQKPGASVVNNGVIRVAPGGAAVLSGSQVANDGLIRANLGEVVLAGASGFAVDMDGDNLLRYRVTSSVKNPPKNADGTVADALVSNSGSIKAAGGTVMMTARAARRVQDDVINNTGIVEATSVSAHDGEIILDAGPNGTVNARGTLDASGRDSGETGGTVAITGHDVNIRNGAHIDASGNAGGGTVRIGGDFHGGRGLRQADSTTVARNAHINADALKSGHGGRVAVWSRDSTNFNGRISAKGGRHGGNGGFIETSSGNDLHIGHSSFIRTTAYDGIVGTWLIDPGCNFVIADSGGNIDPTTITTVLQTTNEVISTASSIVVEDPINYASANNLALLSQANIDVGASIQNTKASSGGGIYLIAGWDGTTGYDGTTLTPSLLTNSGVYGNGSGSVTVGGSNIGYSGFSQSSDIAVGSRSGTTTVAGHDISVETRSENSFDSQIGYSGHTGGGDIVVDATGDVNVVLNSSSSGYAQIGNGAIGAQGIINATGNITLNVDGATTIDDTSGFGTAWIGNYAGEGGTVTGNLSIVTGNFFIDDDNLLGDMMKSTLQGGATPSASIGGDFTLARSNSTGQGAISDYFPNGLYYSSSHTLSLLSNSNITIGSSIQNDGTGALNIVAGWDTSAVSPDSLLANGVGSVIAAGAYGSNAGDVTISPSGSFDIAVGTRTGSTNIAANNLTIETGEYGEGAQLGYAAYDNNTANSSITVNLKGDLHMNAYEPDCECAGGAQIGNGGAYTEANARGGITINAAGDVDIDSWGDGAVAQIGNGGRRSDGNYSGAISISAQNLTLGSHGYESAAQIGNGGLVSFGNASGDITISVDSALTLTADGESGSVAQIGNGGRNSNTFTDPPPGFSDTGNIVVSAKDIAMQSLGDESAVSIGNGGMDAGSGGSFASSILFGGDLTITAKQSLTAIANSPYANVWIGNGGPNSASYVTLDDGSITDSGNINIAVGTASTPGTLVLAANGNDSTAVIGNGSLYGANVESEAPDGIFNTGDINILVKGGTNHGGSLTLLGGENDEDAAAQIGNESNGQVSGDIFVKNDGDTEINGNFSNVWLGNYSDDAEVAGTGDVTILTYSGQLFGYWFLTDLGNTSGAGGNLTVGFSGPEATTFGGITYNSPNNFTLLSSGDLQVISSITNDGTGDVTAVAGWDGHTLGSAAQIAAAGAYGLNNAVLEIGGPNYGDYVLRDVSLGSRLGTTSALGGEVLVDAESGLAQIGYPGTESGNGSGDIDVRATGDVLVEAGAENLVAQIGNGAWNGTGQIGGNVSVQTDGGAVTIQSVGDGSIALIGNLGGNGASESGDVTLETSGGALNLVSGGTQSIAHLGDLANGDGGATSGNVTVDAGAIGLLANGDNSHATIGDGSYAAGVTATGAVSVTGTTLDIRSQGEESRAQIGNIANGKVKGAVSVAITGDVVLKSKGDGSVAYIGNSSGTATSGTVSLVSGGAVSLLSTGGIDAAGYSAATRIGNSGSGNVNVTAAGDVTVAAGSGFALIGDAIGGDGAGNVSLVSGGNLVLSTNGADAVAIVGNMGNSSASGAISGNVDITANGTITLTPAGSGAQTLIGNFDAASLLGNVTIKAASLIGNIDPSLSNDLPNGNFTAAFSGNSTLNVEAFSYTSGYTLDVSNGGDILISGALKNSGSGDISLTSGGAFTANAAIKSGGNIALESAGALTVNNAVTAGDAVAMISGGNTIINAAVTAGAGGAGFASGGNIAFNAGVQTSGNGTIAIVAAHDILFGASVQNSGSGGIAVVSGGDVTIGGNSAGGDVFVGSKAGPLTLVADNLLLDAAKGFAQLGYNGAGSGDITVAAAGGVTLDGGAHTGYYAQIGNGGYKTSGDEGGDITVAAGGDVTLAGGSGQEAYAQIGHGGAEADKNSSGYTNAGFIAVSGQNVVLAAGAGDAAYAQVGHGGYLLGNGLHGTAINDGDITVAAVDSVTLTGDGADGYAQIGNGGDQLNANASASSGGNNGGDISVTVSSATGAVTMTAGADNNSYVQIGNGGYSSNAPTSADASNFTDSGDIFVSDLGLSGSDTGENGYAQIGNGDSSKHGVGNITGNITIAAGTVTVHNGTAAGASALIGNDTGRGTVSGTVSGYSSGDNSGNGAVSALVQNSTTASNAYLASLTTQTFTPPGTLTDQLGTENGSQGPLESMAGDGDTRDSDKAADSLGDSLNGEHGHTKAATLTSQVIIPGVLRELMLANQFQPRAIPSADQDYSSWGNEALWQW